MENELLIFNAKYGNLEDVKHMVSIGANIHIDGERLSAENGHLEVIKYQGADIHVYYNYALRWSA